MIDAKPLRERRISATGVRDLVAAPDEARQFGAEIPDLLPWPGVAAASRPVAEATDGSNQGEPRPGPRPLRLGHQAHERSVRPAKTLGFTYGPKVPNAPSGALLRRRCSHEIGATVRAGGRPGADVKTRPGRPGIVAPGS